jgi:hypothetical protein
MLDMAPGVSPTPKNGKLLNISKTVKIYTPKPYILLSLMLRGIQWFVRHDLWIKPHPKEWEIAEYLGNC